MNSICCNFCKMYIISLANKNYFQILNLIWQYVYIWMNYAPFLTQLILKFYIFFIQLMESQSTGILKGPDVNNPKQILSGLIEKLKAFYKKQDTIPRLINISDDRLKQQKMDDYYIKLQNEVLDDKNGSSKQSIKIQISQLFETFANQPAPKNVLIKGNAGMGKSTFLSYFAYKWGNQQVCSKNEFQFAFKVPLKDLSKSQILRLKVKPMKILTQLIASLFPDVEQGDPISKTDITTILSSGKRILLLLDGFDEIQDLYGDLDNNVQTVIDYMLGNQSKLHILMTSRPNATGSVQQKFHRKVQNKGFDLDEAKKYIKKFFSSNPKNGQILTKILDTNLNMINVIKTPINLFMLCFVVSDLSDKEQENKNEDKNDELIKNFEGQFPISELYNQTLVWMAKRYKHKSEPKMKSINMLTIDLALEKSELRVLKNLAYKKFSLDKLKQQQNKLSLDSSDNRGKYDLTSQEILEESKKFYEIPQSGLIQVYRFGLLRAKGNNTKIAKKESLLNRRFQFVHLSFQQHLTACVLKEKLRSKSELDQAEAVKLIATHRNEPGYLIILKILSGLINVQKISTTQNAETIKKSRALFWEAIVCNVDGILQLGAETRIKLLMHLLSQCNVDQLLKQNIPNIKKIDELINKQVLINLENWNAIETTTNGNLELLTDAKEMLKKYLRGQISGEDQRKKEILRIKNIYELANQQILRNLEKWSQSIISAGYLSDAIARHLMELVKQANQFHRAKLSEQQHFSCFKLVSKIIPHFMHKPLFNNQKTVIFLTTLDYKKDGRGKLANEAMILVVLENIYRLKNYNKMEDKDNFIVFSQKIVPLFFYERTEQLAIKIFYEICLSKEYGFKAKDQKNYQTILTQLSDNAFHTFEVTLVHTFQQKNQTKVSLRQILRLVKFHEAHERINKAISYPLNEKKNPTYLEKIQDNLRSYLIPKISYLEKIKSNSTEAIKKILKLNQQKRFEPTTRYVYENLKQILTLLPRLDKQIFEDIKKRDWKQMEKLPLYDLMSIGNKQLTDNLISFLKEAKQFSQNKMASWRVMSCSWEIFANSKIQIENHDEFKDLINFQRYFFYEYISSKEMEIVKRAVKKHPKLIKLIMNAFYKKLSQITEQCIRGLGNLKELIQILPDITQKAQPIVRGILQNQCLKSKRDLIKAISQAAKQFPACMLNANIMIIIIFLQKLQSERPSSHQFRPIYIRLDTHQESKQSYESIMKPFDLIPKNDTKGFITIFRRLVASYDVQTRGKAIAIYGRLFKRQPQIPIAKELLEQLLPLYHDPNKKVLGEFLQLITLILESEHHFDLKKKLLQQSKKYFEFKDKSQQTYSRFYNVLEFIINMIKSVDQKSEIQIIIQLAQSLKTLQLIYYRRSSLEIWIELLQCSKVDALKYFNSIKQFDTESDLYFFRLKMRCFGLIAKKSQVTCKLVLSQIKQLLMKTEEYQKISFILKALQNILVTFPQMTEALDVMNKRIKAIEQKSIEKNYLQILEDVIDDNQFLAIRFFPYVLRQSLDKIIYNDEKPVKLLINMIEKFPSMRDQLMKNIQAQIKAVQNDKQVVLVDQLSMSRKQFILMLVLMILAQKNLRVDLVESLLLMVRDLVFKFREKNGFYDQMIKIFRRVKLPLKQQFKIMNLFKDLIQLDEENRGQWKKVFIKFAKFMTISDAKYLSQFFTIQKTMVLPRVASFSQYKNTGIFPFQDLRFFLSQLPFQQLIKFQFIEKHISLQLKEQRQIFKKYEKTISQLQTAQDQHQDRYKQVAVLVELSKIKALYNTAQSVLLKIADDFKTPETLAQSNSSTFDYGIDVTPQQKKMLDKLPEKEKTRKSTEFVNSKTIQRKVKFLNKLFLPKQDFSTTEQTEKNYSSIVESQYVRLNTNIPLARQFMKKVAHHLLSDDEIMADDCQFIINCIKCDLTINVSSRGSIVLDDRTYSFDIEKNLQAKKYFEKIVQSALEQNRELVKQYTTFEPYFQSSTNILTKSASDIKNVKSIMMPDQNINDKQNILSFIECKNKVFCLIEQRSFFGDCLVYKVGTQNNLQPFICHPSIIEAKTLHQQALKKFKENIFGLPNIETLKIFSKTITISQKNELLSFIKQRKTNICSQIKQKFLAGINSVEKIKWQIMGYQQLSNQALHFQGINYKNMMQKNYKEFEIKIESIELTLQDSGTYEVADINRSIKQFEKSSKELGTYYRVMYWTLSSFFNSFLNSNTGMIQVNTGFDKTKMQGFIQAGAKQLGKMAISAAKGIPFIGGLAHYLDGFVQKIIQKKDEHQFENKKNSILKIIMGKMQSNTGMSMIIQKTVIQIIRHKKEKILEPKKEESKIQSFLKKVEEFLFAKGSSPFGDENLAAKMAVTDTYLLLSYLYKRQKDIQNITKEQLHVNFAKGFQQFQEKLDKKIADEKKSVENAYLPCGEITACQACCMIYKFEARYDNKILNYPSLIKLFMKQGIIDDLIMHGDQNEPRESLSKEE